MFNPRLVLVALVLVAACRPEPPPPVAPEPTGPTPEEIAARQRADSIARARAEAEARQRAEDEERRAAERRAREARQTLEEVVYFDYDESTLTAETTDRLRAKLGILRGCSGVHLRMEGHADERGTSEYNMALGSERALSVSEFFTGFGLEGVRFATISFGEESPVAAGSNEAAWARNRRVEFVITAGAGDLGGCQG